MKLLFNSNGFIQIFYTAQLRLDGIQFSAIGLGFKNTVFLRLRDHCYFAKELVS